MTRSGRAFSTPKHLVVYTLAPQSSLTLVIHAKLELVLGHPCKALIILAKLGFSHPMLHFSLHAKLGLSRLCKTWPQWSSQSLALVILTKFDLSQTCMPPNLSCMQFASQNKLQEHALKLLRVLFFGWIRHASSTSTWVSQLLWTMTSSPGSNSSPVNSTDDIIIIIMLGLRYAHKWI